MLLGVGLPLKNPEKVFNLFNYLGLAAWWDASTVLNDGSSIDGSNRGSRWQDKSGNGLHLTNGTTANMPVLTTNAIGGKPAFDFNGSSQYFTAGGSALNNVIGGVDSKFTVITAFKADTISGATLIEKFDNSQRQLDYGVFSLSRLSLAAYYTLTSGNARGVRGNTTLSNNTDYLVSMRYDGSIDTNDGRDRPAYKVNGTAQTNTVYSSSGTLGDIPNNGTAHLTIGAAANSSGVATGGFYDGKIAEIIFFNRVITNTELSELGSLYLTPKYGLAT